MRETPQNGRKFAAWWPKIQELAERCNWDRYNAKAAAGDAILQQCDSIKLQKKIIVEDLKIEDIIKQVLAHEQSEKKIIRVNKDNNVVLLEHEVRAFKAGSSACKDGGGSKAKYKMCMRND